MHRLVVQSRVGSDGVMHLDIPMGKDVADQDVRVTVDPVQRASSMSQEEWRPVRHGNGGLVARRPLTTGAAGI